MPESKLDWSKLDWISIKNQTVTVGDLMGYVWAFNEDARHELYTDPGARAYLRGQIELLIDAAGLPMELKSRMAEGAGVKFND